VGAAPSARAALAAGLALLVVYLATLAPSITFWDAAEFAAAARGLGIPHPPGTPLWVVVGRMASFAVPAERAAQATNLLSAICTAAAALVAARLVARWTGSGAMGAAAALAAGGMSTVWLNATETEVYAAALLLAMLTLWAADRAARGAGARWLVLVAYLLALAPAVHLIALLAAPAAIVLAAGGPDGRWSRRDALTLAFVFLAAAAVGRGEPLLAAGAVAALALLAAVRTGGAADGAPRRRTVALGALVAVAVATSALAVLLARAAHDPPLNQGDPSTLSRLADVVARRQYDVAALLPRQAPLWIQATNLLQYADWQVALGIAPGVEPSIPRVLATLGWLAIGILGAAALRRRDRRGWRTLLVLLLAGSIGALLYLNLKAGPTIGWGVLPDTAPHEARERDYFFVFAFWTWGLLAGIGAVQLAMRLRLPAAAGLVIAAAPIPLNWAAVDRTREPEASITRTFAAALLRSAPERSVLLVAADNDTYPLWYLQQVDGLRPDVRVVAVPLLPATWYRDELRRRDSLLSPDVVGAWRGTGASLADLAAGARARGRPLAASPTVAARDRARVAESWTLRGFVYVAGAESSFDTGRDATGAAARAPRVDSAAAEEALRWRAANLHGARPRRGSDPVARQLRALLECPRWALESGRDEGAVRSLDSTCNFR
jgi:hypothetical protein